MNMMKKENSTPLAIYGGTFDPIHYGHLLICKYVASQLDLHKITIIPNHIPPHRSQPIATSDQRLEMIRLAIAEDHLFDIDPRELNKKNYSYTIETLIEIRDELGDTRPLLFIIGYDSLISIDKWHRWDALLDFCHLVVCSRKNVSNTQVSPHLNHWIQAHQVNDPSHLHNSASGSIFLANTPIIDISATQIRSDLKNARLCPEFLSEPVFNYIKEHQIYS